MRSLHIALGLVKQGETYVLQRRAGDPERGAIGKIGCFGGKIEPDETPLAAVCRELGEETSLRPKGADLHKLGELTVRSDHKLEPVAITAHIYAMDIPEDIEVEAYDGTVECIPTDRMHAMLEHMTPATRACFEQLVLKET